MGVEMDVTERPRYADFDDFVLTRSAHLLRFAYLTTHDIEDARDAVQEALTGLYPRWARVSAAGNPEHYVRRSIANAHISQWRKRGAERVADDPMVFEVATCGDHAIAHADADAVARLFARLNHRDRAVLLMRFWEGCSFAEIAAACGCAEATARSIVHRAIRTLRSGFEGEVDG